MKHEQGVFAWVVGIGYMTLAFVITLGVFMNLYETDIELLELIIDFLFYAPRELLFYFVE